MKTPLFVRYFCAFWLVSMGGGSQLKANTAELQTTFSRGVSPGSGSLSFATEAGVTYSLVKSNSLDFSNPQLLGTVAGDGTEKSLSFGEPAQSETAAFYRVQSQAQPVAPDAAAFNSLVVDKTIRGINFASNQRWNALGLVSEGGDWSYQRTGVDSGQVTLTFDESANNPITMRHELTLTFAEGGPQNSQMATYAIVANNQIMRHFGLTVDLTGNSFAPVPEMLTFILDGRTATTALGSTSFSGNGRFVFNGSEPGNWSATLVDANRLRVTQTYDDDGNNPSIYREELVLTFNGTPSIPGDYREYGGGALDFSASGTVTLSD